MKTLEWMDNTYNEHPNVSMAFGHGRTGWFVHEKDGGQKLAHGTIERFSYNGCDMTLVSDDNPVSEKSEGIITTTKSTFSLGDIDISSIKVRSFTHFGGFACDESPQSLAAGFERDHAEMGFKTRSEAPLITEDWHSVYPNLTGADHENRHTRKSSSSDFEFDDIEYAGRFAKAFTHAVQLCGGKPSPF
jgi:hypothetical protein